MAGRARIAQHGRQAPTSKRGRPQDPRRDDAVLDAAVALLREAGSGRVGMREVAERSGTSLATIYGPPKWSRDGSWGCWLPM